MCCEEKGGTAREIVKRLKDKLKTGLQNAMLKRWQEKPLHGQYPKKLNREEIDQEQTQHWLRSAGLKAETEGFLIAAQDQSLPTRNYQKHIMKQNTLSKCRMCGSWEETINHIVSGCPTLAKKEYIYRHDRVGTFIHWKLCQHYEIPTEDRWYKHTPEKVTENDKATILWDMPIHTDREIKANRPDIVVKDHQERKCLLIEVSVPADDNVSLKEMEKLSKYKDLEIEITRMWGLKTETIPIIIGALGMIKKHADKHITKIPGLTDMHNIQKIALLGTAHILRRVLSIQ